MPRSVNAVASGQEEKRSSNRQKFLSRRNVITVARTRLIRFGLRYRDRRKKKDNSDPCGYKESTPVLVSTMSYSVFMKLQERDYPQQEDLANLSMNHPRLSKLL